MADPITDAASKIKALIEAGIAAEELTGYTTVHAHHCVADLSPTCVSVDVDDFEAINEGLLSGTGPMRIYEVTVSVRLHTGYLGDPCIGSTNATLIESITQYLLLHIDLGNNYRISDTSSADLRSTFDDSKTVGAQLQVVVKVPVTYEQA